MNSPVEPIKTSAAVTTICPRPKRRGRPRTNRQRCPQCGSPLTANLEAAVCTACLNKLHDEELPMLLIRNRQSLGYSDKDVTI